MSRMTFLIHPTVVVWVSTPKYSSPGPVKNNDGVCHETQGTH